MAIPLPSRGDQQRTDQRPDDAARSEPQPVSRQQADQQSADEGPDQSGHQRQRPVNAFGRLAQDQLCASAHQHAEQNEPGMSMIGSIDDGRAAELDESVGDQRFDLVQLVAVRLELNVKVVAVCRFIQNRSEVPSARHNAKPCPG